MNLPFNSTIAISPSNGKQLTTVLFTGRESERGSFLFLILMSLVYIKVQTTVMTKGMHDHMGSLGRPCNALPPPQHTHSCEARPNSHIYPAIPRCSKGILFGPCQKGYPKNEPGPPFQVFGWAGVLRRSVLPGNIHAPSG